MPDVVDSRSAIFDAALDAIITVNHEGRILEFNAAAEQIFGVTRRDACGRLLVDTIIPERFAMVSHELRTPLNAELAGPHRGVGGDGRPGSRSRDRQPARRAARRLGARGERGRGQRQRVHRNPAACDQRTRRVTVRAQRTETTYFFRVCFALCGGVCVGSADMTALPSRATLIA
jgi:PAS domain-containing protein